MPAPTPLTVWTCLGPSIALDQNQGAGHEQTEMTPPPDAGSEGPSISLTHLLTVILVSGAALALYCGVAIAVSLMVSNHDRFSIGGGLIYFGAVTAVSIVSARRSLTKYPSSKSRALRSSAAALLIMHILLSPVGLLILSM